jgi:hypothetical protein
MIPAKTGRSFHTYQNLLFLRDGQGGVHVAEADLKRYLHWRSLGSRLRLLQNAADTTPFGSIGSCRSKEIDRIISAVMGRDGLRHLAGEVLR